MKNPFGGLVAAVAEFYEKSLYDYKIQVVCELPLRVCGTPLGDSTCPGLARTVTPCSPLLSRFGGECALGSPYICNGTIERYGLACG